jgi:hypothetical protein
MRRRKIARDSIQFRAATRPNPGGSLTSRQGREPELGLIATPQPAAMARQTMPRRAQRGRTNRLFDKSRGIGVLCGRCVCCQSSSKGAANWFWTLHTRSLRASGLRDASIDRQLLPATRLTSCAAVVSSGLFNHRCYADKSVQHRRKPPCFGSQLPPQAAGSGIASPAIAVHH